MSHADKNGGYYAIKGFEYQIDKTILSILNSTNETDLVYAEQIQDLDSDNYVMQIKYKETQKFAPSKIKEPIIDLLREFSSVYTSDKSKIYYLYCYFLDQPEGTKNIDILYLNRILGNKSTVFSDDIKQKFIKDFILVFSPDFQSQFSQVVTRIKDTFCSSKTYEEAVFYYSNIANFLRKKIVENSDPACRSCTKKELICLIQDGKKIVFDSAFREFKGDQNYFKYIKSKINFRNVDDYERFFVIQSFGNESIADIKQVVLKIKNKFYIKNKRALKSGAPYIFIRNISKENLKALKAQLYSDNYVLRDGHDYLDAEFNNKTLIEHASLQNNVCIKFINEEAILQNIVTAQLGKTKEIYQFYIDAPLSINADERQFSVQIKNLTDISNIF